jgi:hypothetical protein
LHRDPRGSWGPHDVSDQSSKPLITTRVKHKRMVDLNLSSHFEPEVGFDVIGNRELILVFVRSRHHQYENWVSSRSKPVSTIMLRANTNDENRTSRVDQRRNVKGMSTRRVWRADSDTILKSCSK